LFQPVQSETFQLPAAMADTAAPVDNAYDFIFWFSVVFLTAITVAMLYFVMKYKRRPGVKAEPTGHFVKLEVFWTVTPIVFIFFLFHAGFTGYIRNATAAEGATEIRVRAKKWSWEFEYPTGDRAPGELTLELGRPYKMIISSEDVLHSFFIPEFRMKRDAVPGQYSFIQFTPTKAGEAHVFCAEYCGTSHSGMLATVKVLTTDQYKAWQESLGGCQGTPEECMPAKWGESLYLKNGCSSCHGPAGAGEIAGTKTPGPKLAGLIGREEATTAGPVMADENYIRESILEPQAKITAGYTTVQMPPFVMKDKQLDAIIAYMKSLK
jgi:cytochrome c oxidase subunit 2